LNGVSVSKSAKIGERPYPSPFHPVGIPPKSRRNQLQMHQIHVKSQLSTPTTHHKRI